LGTIFEQQQAPKSSSFPASSSPSRGRRPESSAFALLHQALGELLPSGPPLDGAGRATRPPCPWLLLQQLRPTDGGASVSASASALCWARPRLLPSGLEIKGNYFRVVFLKNFHCFIIL
jgi:hypothetical protein